MSFVLKTSLWRRGWYYKYGSEWWEESGWLAKNLTDAAIGRRKGQFGPKNIVCTSFSTPFYLTPINLMMCIYIHTHAHYYTTLKERIWYLSSSKNTLIRIILKLIIYELTVILCSPTPHSTAFAYLSILYMEAQLHSGILFNFLNCLLTYWCKFYWQVD